MNNPQQLLHKALHRALSNWQSWQVGEGALTSQPQPVRELSGGKTNHSFLVASGSFEAVVRINAANSESLGIDRQREQIILKLLQPTGTVPKVFFCDSQLLVTSYCGGQHWVDTPKNRQNLNDALGKIQSVATPNLEKRNYMAYCSAYINQLAQAQRDQQVIESVLSAAEAIDNSDWTPVICHHDLVGENIIITESGPILLDWEYAALGHPALDALRLFKNDLCSIQGAYDTEVIGQLTILQQGMDDLWSLLQSN